MVGLFLWLCLFWLHLVVIVGRQSEQILFCSSTFQYMSGFSVVQEVHKGHHLKPASLPLDKRWQLDWFVWKSGDVCVCVDTCVCLSHTSFSGFLIACPCFALSKMVRVSYSRKKQCEVRSARGQVVWLSTSVRLCCDPANCSCVVQTANEKVILQYPAPL